MSTGAWLFTNIVQSLPICEVMTADGRLVSTVIGYLIARKSMVPGHLDKHISYSKNAEWPTLSVSSYISAEVSAVGMDGISCLLAAFCRLLHNEKE